MKRIKILYAGALVALSFSSVGCNDSESDLLEPKLYFESNVIRVEVEADTYECELVSRLSTMVKSNVVVAYLLYNRYRYGNGSSIQSDRESLVGRGWRSGYWCDCNGEGDKHWNCD